MADWEGACASAVVCVKSWLSFMAWGLVALGIGACELQVCCGLSRVWVGDGEGLMLLPLVMSESLGWLDSVLVVSCVGGFMSKGCGV